MKTVLTIIFLFFIITANAQYDYRFSVFDTTGKRLSKILIKGGERKIYSDSSGNAIINTSLPIQTFTFSGPGFETLVKVCIADEYNQVILRTYPKSLPEARVYAFESSSGEMNVAASVTKLSMNNLNRFSNTEFVTVLNSVPGVKMDERSPGSYRISIRGNLQRSTFGIRNVKIYWNGIPFTDANGTSYFNQIALNTISTVEVIRGPGSSMYGAGTSGVLLLRSEDYSNGFSSELSSGNPGKFNMYAAYETNSSKNETRTSFSHTQSEGYRMHSEMKRSVFHFNSNSAISEKNNLMINLMYSDLNYETPGALTKSEMNSDPRQARPAAGMFPGAEQQKAAVYLKTIYSGISLETKISSSLRNLTGFYVSQTEFRNPAIRNYERKKEQGAGARSVFNFHKNNFRITGGGEFQYSFTNTGTYGNRNGVQDTLQYRDEIASRQYNFFIQVNYHLNKFIFSTAASLNNYYYGFHRTSIPDGKKESSVFNPELIPRLSVLYKFTSQLNLYASFGKGYSPPSIDEVHASDGVFNKGLYAEQSTGYETGIKGKLKNMSFELSLYLLNLDNTIVSRRDSSGADYYLNSGKTRQKGLEISIRNDLLKKETGFLRSIKCIVSYSYIYARYKDYKQGLVDLNGKKLTGTPSNVVVLNFEFATASVYLNAGYSYTGSVPLNDLNTFYGQMYNQLFIKAGYRLAIKLKPEIFATLDRSFNNPYGLGHDLNAAGNRYFNPSAPYSFTAGIRISGIK